MQGNLNADVRSLKDNQVLNVKPLRTLTPMFPAPYGYTASTPPGNGPAFIQVKPWSGQPSSIASPFTNIPGPEAATPTRPTANGATTRSRAANGPINPSPVNARPMNAKPVDASPITPYSSYQMNDSPVQTSRHGRRIKRPGHVNGQDVGGSDTDGSDAKARRKAAKRIASNELVVLPTASQDPREMVEVVLMTFDALRRRLLQLDEAKDGGKRADLRASAIMMSKDLRANMGRRIGPVPGIEISDIFYFRMELCLVGLHAPSMAGIDYITSSFGNDQDTVALSIVSAGGYDNEEEDTDVLVYTGSGGISKFDRKPADDQKLERGNLALERSLHRGNQVRVVRSAKDFNVINGKIYIYDGLYKIVESWVEKAKTGFNVFKYKLVREPGQSDGIVIWKKTQKWIENPSSRGQVILPDISSGVENIPVCLVNEVDREKGPGVFRYITSMKYLKHLNSQRPSQGCRCLSVCLPGDVNCSCAEQNGGDLPYSSSGFLVSHKPVIYECSAACQCSINCRNRVTQKGVRLHFEVFRTENRGWGLRSWEPIRAGTFVCEYAGEVIDNYTANDGVENEYVFCANYVDERTLNWNFGPELLGEPSTVNYAKDFKLPIVINAKNMGNVSRFMNHSCSPNVFWQAVQHNHNDVPHIMFFALKHIPPMTELTYDYGVSTDGDGSCTRFARPKNCLCGSPKCRGIFG